MAYHTRCEGCDCRLMIDEDRWCEHCEPEPDPAEEARVFWEAAQKLAARTHMPNIFANHDDCIELAAFQETL